MTYVADLEANLVAPLEAEPHQPVRQLGLDVFGNFLGHDFGGEGLSITPVLNLQPLLGRRGLEDFEELSGRPNRKSIEPGENVSPANPSHFGWSVGSYAVDQATRHRTRQLHDLPESRVEVLEVDAQGDRVDLAVFN